MSSLTRHAKAKMAGLLQGLLGRLAPTPPGTEQAAQSKAAAATPSPKPPSIRIAPPARPAGHSNGRTIEIPIQPIIAALPLELQPRVKQQNAGALTLSVALEKILAQLASGAVKIPFGALRQAAPALFTEASDRDQVLVSIPLAEVLTRLNPALITRRREQKQVEVPAEISSPFDRRGQGLILAVGPAEHEAASPAPARQTVPPAGPPVLPLSRSSIAFTPKPIAPAPALVSMPSIPLPSRYAPDPGASHSPLAPVAPVTKPAGSHEPLVVGLSTLAEGWPETILKEITDLNLVDAKVSLPAEIVERALKQGRVAFSWKALRSWIKPAPLPTVSAHDGAVLELPLKIVAPLFLARQHEATKGKKRVAIDEDIPNLFFGFPQPESVGAKPPSSTRTPAPKLTDTNYYVWDDTADRATLSDEEIKRQPSPGTRFVAKYATPNEVVSRAAAFDGVAGALIALPDGLMVASRLSPDLNGDTLAAFLPQIFGKVSHCTKELRMGELNNLNFTVGNVPWKIFRVNAIFFAAFGRAGEPLPTAKLAALAAELDHKPK